MNKNIVIIGTSGHAKVIIDIVEREGRYTIIGLIDTYKEVGSKTFDYAVLGSEHDLPEIVNTHNVYGGIIAIGDNAIRANMHQRILDIFNDFKFVNAVHPNAIVAADVSFGKGTVVMPGVVINSATKIEDFCIVNTKALLGNSSKLRSYSSLGPGVSVGSNVEVKEYSAISLGAKIKDNLTVGKHTVIGAGSIVDHNIGSEKVAFGCPAVEVRSRYVGEYYLSGNKKKFKQLERTITGSILITSAGRRVSLVKSFKNEIQKLGLDLKVMCSDSNPEMSAACQMAFKQFKTPKVSDPNYISSLVNLCIENHVKVLIPTIDTELLVLSQNKTEFEENGIELILSDTNFIEKCRDKRRIHDFFDEIKFNRAKEYNLDELEFPTFVKPIDGSSSIGIYLINEEKELTEELTSNPKNMFLEYFDSQYYEEYTVDIYFNKTSKIISIVPRQRLFVRGGEVNKGCTRKNEIIEFVKEKLDRVEGLRGCITLQVFFHKEHKSVYGIEINPRFGGGFPLSYLAGANFPLWIIKEYILNEPVEVYSTAWEDNLLMLRYDDEVLSHGYTR